MDLTIPFIIICWILETVPLDGVCKAQFRQVHVRPADTVILPCIFTVYKPLLSNISVIWRKTSGSNMAIVHIEKIANDDVEELQDTNYKRRTNVHPEWPYSGHANLTLYNVTKADLGKYTCFINIANWSHICSDVHIKLAQRKEAAVTQNTVKVDKDEPSSNCFFNYKILTEKEVLDKFLKLSRASSILDPIPTKHLRRFGDEGRNDTLSERSVIAIITVVFILIAAVICVLECYFHGPFSRNR